MKQWFTLFIIFGYGYGSQPVAHKSKTNMQHLDLALHSVNTRYLVLGWKLTLSTPLVVKP